MKGFVLLSVSRGDELIHSEKKVIATSEDRGTLETLKESKEQARDAWLKTNYLPYWAQAGILDYEIAECEMV
jgi:hypothetical protein